MVIDSTHPTGFGCRQDSQSLGISWAVMEAESPDQTWKMVSRVSVRLTAVCGEG